MPDISIVVEGIDNASQVLGNVATAAGGLATVVGGALAAGMAYSVKQAMDAQKAQANLAQVIKSTGGAAGLTQDAANKLADQFRDLAGGTSEAVVKIEEIGLRAGTISADQMPKFIQTTLDLGTVMGSTEAAAELLARAQEDPAAAMNKAQRAGIIFSESLKEQIKQLEKAGKTGDATKLVLDRIAEATGGAAQANADTFAGKWELLQGHLSEAAQTIGNAVLPVLQTLFDNVIAPAIPVIEDLAQQFSYVLQALASGDTEGALYAFTEGFDILSNAFPQFAGGIGEVQSAFANLPDTLSQVQVFLEPLVNAFDTLWAAIQLQGPAALAQMQDFFGWLQQNVGPVVTLLRDDLANAVVAIAQIWAAHGDEIMTVVRYVFEVIVATVAGTIEIISGLITAGLQALNGNWSGAWQTITDTFTGFMNMVLSIAGTDLPNFVATWTGIWNNVQTIVSAVLMNMTSGIQTWIITTINTVKDKFGQFYQLGSDLMDNVLRGILLKVSQIINTVRDTVTNAIAAAGNALGGGGPQGNGAGYPGVGHRAGGGPVGAGGAYVVGENGPELLLMGGSSGTIVPNDALGGGAQTIVVQLDGDVLLQAVVNNGRSRGMAMVQVQ